MYEFDLEPNPLHLIQADIVATSIVQLSGARRGVVRHRGGVLQRPTVLEVGGDAGRSKRVVADRGLDARCLGAPSHHGVRVGLGKRRAAQLPGTAPDRAKQRPFRVAVDPRLGQVRVQVLLQPMVTGHFMPLASLFM